MGINVDDRQNYEAELTEQLNELTGSTNQVKAATEILRWFSFHHLKGKQRSVSSLFAGCAVALLEAIPDPSRELTVALRKLLEAKDAAVRASFDSE